jgi:hypothetical protein
MCCYVLIGLAGLTLLLLGILIGGLLALEYDTESDETLMCGRACQQKPPGENPQPGTPSSE